MANELLFIDTSAFYAFFDKKDNEHKNIVKIFKSSNEQFVTSNYILDELITLFRVRGLAIENFITFVNALWNEEVCKIFRVTVDIDLQAWEIMKQFKDQNFSFTDCTSFILMREYRIQKVCTLDKHFQIAGFEIVK